MKLFGGLLIILAAGWTGAAPVWRLRARERILESLALAMELLRAELRSSLAPLPELFASVARASGGIVASFFGQVAESMLREPMAAPLTLIRRALPMLRLPDRDAAILLELGTALGCYDLDSQLRMLDSAQSRLQQEALHCSKRVLGEGRGWGALGLCTGLALAIVLV